MSYQVKLDKFEGPLELLLHLIEQAKVDIYDIPIAAITEQYMDYLDKMQRFDMEVASEFLVMAATLLYIKSKMLLPKKEVTHVTEEEEGQSDPRQELVTRLLEYKKYKEVTAYFQELWNKRSAVVTRPPAVLDPLPPLLTGVSLEDLVQAFARVWRQAHQDTAVIASDKITVADKMEQILALLEERPGGVEFMQVLGPGATRSEVVVAFLAVLELLRLRRIAVVQEDLFAPIRLFLQP